MAVSKLYERNYNLIMLARSDSGNDGERDVAWTLIRIKQINPGKSVEECVDGFARWAEDKWRGGMVFPRDLKKYLSDWAYSHNSGDSFKDWLWAQDYVAKQVTVLGRDM